MQPIPDIIAEQPIKVLVPKMPRTEELLPYLRRIDSNLWYTNFGPLEKELRTRLENKYSAYVVTVSSCTAGLELMYRHIREDLTQCAIELPSLTFPATCLAARRAGLWVEFADISPTSWAHPAVASFGVPATGTFVDAAAAFGEQLVLPGQTAVFSLHATKPIGAGEGGFIVTHSLKLARMFRRQTNFGIEDGISREWGTNNKLSEYHAAVALAALDSWQRDPWLNLYDWYERHIPLNVRMQIRPRGAYPIIAVLLPPNASITLVQEHLARRNIETRRWYYPAMHTHPEFAGQGKPSPLPNTEDISQRLLGLPYHLFLSEEDVIRVCTTLADFLTVEI